MGQILSAILAPELAGVAQEFEKLNPTQQLAVADVVDAIIRGHLSQTQAQGGLNSGQDEARLSGLSPERLQVLVDNAGEPLPLQTLTEAWRRKLIPQSGTGADSISLEQGIRESRLKNKWIPVVEKLQFNLPPPGVIVEGWLRAQITEAEALGLLYQNGIDEATARLMYNSAGRPPGPQELLELFRRGVIPESGTGVGVLSLDQGYLETDLKNKWLPAWKQLQHYIPPPRTVTAMVREGALSDAQALAYFKDAGLSQELAAAYLEAAHHQRSAATKELAKSDILALLIDELIDEPSALQMLETLGYPETAANFEIGIARMRAEHAQLNSILGRLRALYIGHKIDKQAALGALDSLGLSAAARDRQLALWAVAEQNNVAILSPAQIAELVKLEWLAFATGAGLLEGHGYSPADAQLYLLAHLKIPPGPGLPPGVTVSPA